MLYSRLRIIIGIFALVWLALFARFFYLQVMMGDEYSEAAEKLHWGGIRLPAQRGEIIIQDNLTGENISLATNANLELLYFDPKFMLTERKVGGLSEQIGSPEAVVRELAPILWPVFVERKKDAAEKEKLTSEAELPGNRYFIKQDQQVIEMTGLGGMPLNEWRDNCIDRCQTEKSQASLNLSILEPVGTGANTIVQPEITEEIISQCEDFCQYRDPRVGQKTEDDLDSEAPVTAEDDPENPDPDSMIAFRDWLRSKIYDNKDKRYIPIIRRIPPEVSEQIDLLEDTINMKGVVRLDEPWRFYPEGELASSLVGFTDHDKIGRYGIEQQYDRQLQGKDGRILTEKDTAGRDIAVGEKIVERAEDGIQVELTIDRTVQSRIESILQRKVEEFSADSAQAIVMEPDTGRIIAMAQYPVFDPNNFWDVYQRRYLTDPELQKISGEWEENHREYPIMSESGSDGLPSYYVYQNAFGPAVYRNKSVDEVWEPGSIFKSLVMAAALDAHTLTPDTRCDICHEPIKLNEYYVHTWNDKYRPNQTMSQTLQWSDNTGMVFVAQKLGKKLMWRYLKNFGFGERTGLGFDTEQKGVLPLWRYLADIDHATLAFGQGISATSVQIITAFSSLVNGGYLMQPHIIDQVTYPDGEIDQIEPEVRRRVISDEASAMISSMLVSVIEEGGGKYAAVDGYYVGGKTGTAQISGFYTDKKDGVRRYGYEEGIGTTIASFVGFGPLRDPQFTVLVKVDRPRANEWGSHVAAPIFSEIAEFLLEDYYRVPPER